jgi:hypothetical protein
MARPCKPQTADALFFCEGIPDVDGQGDEFHSIETDRPVRLKVAALQLSGARNSTRARGLA